MAGPAVAEGDAERQSIQVAVRVRPLSARERSADEAVVVTVGDGGDIQVKVGGSAEPRRFAFDYSYGMGADQQRVHEDLGRTLLANAVNGYNACLFAYGQTGTGKSWSVTGDQRNAQHRGLLPRICESVFGHFSGNSSVADFSVVCTYLEIYNEKIKDLLAPSSVSLEVRKHPTQGVYVPNLSQVPVRSYSDVLNLLEAGNSVRRVGVTAMNEQSSRTHAVCSLKITQTLRDKKQQRAQLHIVDLAGSERQKKTEAEGARLKEGAMINQSLTVLGQVIFALAGQQSGSKGVQHVPFRNSKLTFLLSDALSGNSRTVMIAAIAPTVSNYEETLNTLRFAQSVKKVKTQVVKNETMDQNPEAVIQQLRQQIQELKSSLSQETAAEVPVPRHAEAAAVPAEASKVAHLEQQLQRLQADKTRFEELFRELDEQQPCDTIELLENIEHGIADGAEADQSIVERFADVRENAEQANFIMAWMMEHGFAPRSEGQATWNATITWKVSAEPPHLLGTLQSQLVVRREDGAEKVEASYNEDNFQTMLHELVKQYETCTKELNETSELAPPTDPSKDASEESPERQHTPQRQHTLSFNGPNSVLDSPGMDRKFSKDTDELQHLRAENARLRLELEESRRQGELAGSKRLSKIGRTSQSTGASARNKLRPSDAMSAQFPSRRSSKPLQPAPADYR